MQCNLGRCLNLKDLILQSHRFVLQGSFGIITLLRILAKYEVKIAEISNCNWDIQ